MSQADRPKGQFAVEHLRPNPEAMDQFMPLWDARIAVLEKIAIAEQQAEIGELSLAVAERYIRILKIEHDCLSLQMRPFQHMVGVYGGHNLITDAGAKDLLDKYFKGSGYTQTMRMGLKGTGAAAFGDTQSSHAGWLEQGLANAPTYSGSRPSQTFNAATGSGLGGRISSTPTQAFSITSNGTVHGLFLNNGGSATIDNTTGILVNVGNFDGGPRAVVNLDTLNCTYTLTL